MRRFVFRLRFGKAYFFDVVLSNIVMIQESDCWGSEPNNMTIYLFYILSDRISNLKHRDVKSGTNIRGKMVLV
jgi:hypothetical protein